MITSDLVIDATVDRVWDLTIDVEGWPALTPTMTSVERLDTGPLQVGSTARIRQPRQRPAVWTVTRLDPKELFAWQTKLGWLTMAATHRLQPLASGMRNTLTVEVSGFGAGLLTRLLGRQLRQAIDTENAGFKAAAEAPADQSAA